MDSALVLVLLACALVLVGWWIFRNWKAQQATVYQPKMSAAAAKAEPFQTEGWGTYRFDTTDRTDSSSVVVAALARAIDANVPEHLVASALQPGQLVPYDATEVRDLARGVLARVRDLDLDLLEVDATSKTVDAAKNLTYVMTLNTYSAKMNIGVKLVATLIVPPTNQVYLAALKTYNSQPDAGNAGPVGAGPDDAPELAPFEEAVPF
jgi:hypothetical protein